MSAALSPTGAARELIRYGLRGVAELVISPLVEEEVRRNLTQKAPDALSFYELLLEILPFQRVAPTEREIQKAASVVASHDAPILAAAVASRALSLATWDRKHLLAASEAALDAGLVAIVTPDEVLAALRPQAPQE